MPAFASIPDPSAGPQAQGRIRYDRRTPASTSAHRPLVLLGGMTQTISSWSGQIRPLAADREVIAYEARGQGSTELDVRDCSTPRHVEDFVALLEALGIEAPVDLCGFSFGGRTALAIAAERPELVHRLVLTGIAGERGIVGRLIVKGWIASLRTGDLEALARISLADILGGPYLERHAELIESMVKTTMQRNRYEGVRALFEQTLALPEDSPWSVDALAPRISAPALVMGGALDRLAPPSEVVALAERLGASHRVFAEVGHTVPIEAPEAWRAAVMEFLAARVRA